MKYGQRHDLRNSLFVMFFSVISNFSLSSFEFEFIGNVLFIIVAFVFVSLICEFAIFELYVLEDNDVVISDNDESSFDSLVSSIFSLKF